MEEFVVWLELAWDFGCGAVGKEADVACQDEEEDEYSC